MARFAGVRNPGDREDSTVHNVGACLTNVDAETRASMEQNRVLSDALAAADCNQDKSVTVRDATLIQIYLAEMTVAGSYVGQRIPKSQIDRADKSA